MLSLCSSVELLEKARERERERERQRERERERGREREREGERGRERERESEVHIIVGSVVGSFETPYLDIFGTKPPFCSFPCPFLLTSGILSMQSVVNYVEQGVLVGILSCGFHQEKILVIELIEQAYFLSLICFLFFEVEWVETFLSCWRFRV